LLDYTRRTLVWTIRLKLDVRLLSPTNAQPEQRDRHKKEAEKTRKPHDGGRNIDGERQLLHVQSPYGQPCPHLQLAAAAAQPVDCGDAVVLGEHHGRVWQFYCDPGSIAAACAVVRSQNLLGLFWRALRFRYIVEEGTLRFCAIYSQC
jgi:hypothetical protein